MKQDVPCSLQRTNIFLRLVFFFFTALSLGAAVGLLVLVLSPGSNMQGPGALMLIFAPLCYWGAEALVWRKRLYRYGIEEGLAVGAVLLLCLGIQFTFYSRVTASDKNVLVPVCGAIAALWIYRRFSFQYAFAAAMMLAALLPGYWTASQTAQHAIITAAYAIALIVLIRIRRAHRFDFADDEYSITEALLWIGIYIAVNLQLSSIDLLRRWWVATGSSGSFPKPFYWTTWVLTWCLPVLMLGRALRQRDRALTAIGLIAAILTLITNKPYLGWQRHPWDPMLLGVLLIGAAIALKRWLTHGENEVRHGFTAHRLSVDDKRFQTMLATLGVAAAIPSAPAPVSQPGPTFGGGDSAGGGATSDF